MSSTGTPKRRRNTQVLDVINISDDESAAHQQPVKRQPLSSPPAPSTKEVELQQKVAKSEDMYKKAVRAATDEKSARNRAESLLDSKRGILENQKNEVEKEMGTRLAELSKQLDEARRRAEESNAREMWISRENDSLKVESAKQILIKNLLTKEVLELKRGVDDSRRMGEHNSEKDKLKSELADIKEQLTAAAKQRNYLSEMNSILTEQVKISQRTGKNKEELSRENTALKKQLDKVNEISDGRKERIRKLRDKMASMKEKLKESAKQRNMKLVQCKGQQSEQQKSSEKPIDLFEQGLAVSSKAISFDDACKKMKAKLYTSGNITWWRIANKAESQSCNPCDVKLKKTHDVFAHFLSRRHVNQMKNMMKKARGGAVSRAALDYWIGKIEEGKKRRRRVKSAAV